jgi:MbtH protein
VPTVNSVTLSIAWNGTAPGEGAANIMTSYFSDWIKIRNVTEKVHTYICRSQTLAAIGQAFTTQAAQIQMNNPFDDKDGEFFALINEQGQYSLWPAFIDIPAGWTVAHPKASRDICLEHINTHWTDMRPKSLIDAMEKSST